MDVEAPRRVFPFAGAAEATPVNSESITARVRELSLFGCFLEVAIPFRPGTRVMVKIFKDTEIFEADGSVTYSQPNVGLGLTFGDTKPHSLAVLQRWLLAAKKKHESQAS